MLYYVDTSDCPIIEVFKPRIPKNRMMGENATIPRICLSTSIEGCFSAAPWGADDLEYRPYHVVYRVYEFDATKIPEEHIYTTKRLMEEKLVPDAESTNEIWVVQQKLIPDNMYYIILDDYDIEIKEYENDDICDFYTNIIRLKCHKVEDIEFVKEFSFIETSKTWKGSWLEEIVNQYTYFPYRDIDILKKDDSVKVTLPHPQPMALEHLDMMMERAENERIYMSYR